MTRMFILLIAMSFFGGAVAQQTAEVQRSNHYLDHVVVGINDLEKGVDALERLTGVKAKFDGRDARLGTQSAIMALGENSFLEIMAPDPKADPEQVDSELAKMFLEPLSGFESLTPFLWAIGTSNLDRSRLYARRANSFTSDPDTGSRKRGWGRRVDWRWSQVIRPKSYVMPLFVEWSKETDPPQERAPEGCTLDQLHVRTRVFKSVHNLLAATQVEVDLKGADIESLGLTLDCEGEEVVIDGKPLH